MDEGQNPMNPFFSWWFLEGSELDGREWKEMLSDRSQTCEEGMPMMTHSLARTRDAKELQDYVIITLQNAQRVAVEGELDFALGQTRELKSQ